MALCEPWCADGSHCAFCKCRGCAQLSCTHLAVSAPARLFTAGGASAVPGEAATCKSTHSDDVDHAACEGWCQPAEQPSHCEYCKCKACSGCE